MKKALIVWGGWMGHEPDQVAEHFAGVLRGSGFEVEVSDTLASLEDAAAVRSIDLFVPVITMATIERVQLDNILDAVINHGVGIAGCHGGMCDAFRNEADWQFMTGGQWVAHPGDNGVRYALNFCSSHELVAGMSDFEVTSEQYYLHVDPGVEVLATTNFPSPGADGPHVHNPCKMPQVWVKRHGAGRVFYNALGHNRAVFDVPEATELMRRGFVWAAR
jgi:type 1 glutamine amidotransferase